MDLLQTLLDELQPISPATQISLEAVKGSLEKRSENFYPTETIDRYWLPGTEDLGAWITADGSQVTIVIREGTAIATLYKLLEEGFSALVAGLCLSLQQRIAIHANAIAIDDAQGNAGAIVLVGESGIGKSTLSTFAASQGARFLADDVVVIEAEGWVMPGFSQVRLYSDVVETFNSTIETVSVKRQYNLQQFGGTRSCQSVPLRAIYWLQNSEDDRIYTQAIAPSSAAFALLDHSYLALNVMARCPAIFDRYGQLAQLAPLKQLFYPRSFSVLSDVYAYLLAECCAFDSQSHFVSLT